MAVTLMFRRDAVLISGVEDDPGGLAVRVYIGPRYRRRYYLISEPEARERARRAWGGHHGHLVSTHEELSSVGIFLEEGR